ncbi:hypothetical protein NEMBOFW57_001254 [Staphylotrichum longicolle]|uniref:NWD NACHT-NTPase N-terminal domain-containing protein n=1 Tax=Staphylotrichum longicolle TaxID=669026 RepID=A0AAD4I0N2_9PEZI|nr:hypothetical protein NEMBOFW57_001254 [Staphylotrichum longicolle]
MYSSSPSAAAATAAAPGTDARVPLPPALPAESAPKPPPTESSEQPTPVLSVSEKLWNAAYDSLETDNAELVMSYMKTLETVLAANPVVTPNTNISAELYNPTKRQMHMRRLILQNPVQATKSNLAGIAHVISRMDWYYALAEYLLNENNIAAGKDFQVVLRQLEKGIVELYKALL